MIYFIYVKYTVCFHLFTVGIDASFNDTFGSSTNGVVYPRHYKPFQTAMMIQLTVVNALQMIKEFVQMYQQVSCGQLKHAYILKLHRKTLSLLQKLFHLSK